MTPGHNAAIDRNKLQQFFKRLDTLEAGHAELCEAHKEDCLHIFKEAAEAFGINPKIIRHAYRTHRQKLKLEEREANMDPHDKHVLDVIRSGLEGTPLGDAAGL